MVIYIKLFKKHIMIARTKLRKKINLGFGLFVQKTIFSTLLSFEEMWEIVKDSQLQKDTHKNFSLLFFLRQTMLLSWERNGKEILNPKEILKEMSKYFPLIITPIEVHFHLDELNEKELLELFTGNELKDLEVATIAFQEYLKRKKILEEQAHAKKEMVS